MLMLGLQVLSRYKNVEKAHEVFLKAGAKCALPASECNQIWEWCIANHDGTKGKYSEGKTKLNAAELERILDAFNIKVRVNLFTRELEVSDLPESKYIQRGYYDLKGLAKKQANRENLPLFLWSYLNENSYSCRSEMLMSMITVVGNTNVYNPVLDMLKATRWDGEDRISKLCDVLNMRMDSFYCEIIRKWLHQAVSLALNDEGDIGLEFVLVLQGAQGLGKTNFFRRLAVRPEWFCEGAVINVDDKDTIIQATGTWICELGELDSTLKKEQASLKSFLTRNFDEYRPPYGRSSIKRERRTCFCATVNPEKVNRDDTGSRRFVYVHVDSMDKDFIYEKMTPEWSVQLWRQVYE